MDDGRCHQALPFVQKTVVLTTLAALFARPR
jgi:hypothetical protein